MNNFMVIVNLEKKNIIGYFNKFAENKLKDEFILVQNIFKSV